MINKIWWKIVVWFSHIFNIFFLHSIKFPRINPSSAIKIFIVFFTWYKYQLVSKCSWRKIFCSITNTKLIYQIFCQLFVDFALNFFDCSFNSFLFKSIFFTKLAKSLLLAKSAYDKFAVKLSDVIFLNSWVVIYLSWSLSVVTLFSIWIIFVFWSVLWLNY